MDTNQWMQRAGDTSTLLNLKVKSSINNSLNELKCGKGMKRFSMFDGDRQIDGTGEEKKQGGGGGSN